MEAGYSEELATATHVLKAQKEKPQGLTRRGKLCVKPWGFRSNGEQGGRYKWVLKIVLIFLSKHFYFESRTCIASICSAP